MAAEVPTIEVRNLYKVFSSGAAGKVVAVDDVSFALEGDPPRIVSLVGESGSGKSTVARLILGLTKPSHGLVLFNGHDVHHLNSSQFDAYRRNVQVVFQDPYGIFNPFYRIDQVFEIVLRNFKLASSREKGWTMVSDALKAVDLRPEDVLGRYPHQLSGGERQRVMLARTYLLRPKVIVADEPVSMLDAAVRVLFLNILQDFKDNHGISTLFITHDLSTAYYLGGDILVMLRGRVVERGPVGQVLSQPAHPYTRLLLQSIPRPDPDQRWTDRLPPRLPMDVAASAGHARCIFVDRCPNVMEVCRQRRPQPYAVAEGQQAACFLYGDSTLGEAGARTGSQTGFPAAQPG